MERRGPGGRPVVGALVATTTVGGTDVVVWHGLAGDRSAALAPGADLAALVTGLAAVAAQAALTWLLLLVVLVVLEPWVGRDLASYAGCPRSLRRLLLLLCGAAVAGALAAPAQAAPAPATAPAATGDQHTGDRGAPTPSTRLAPAVLEGLPVPDRAVGGAGPAHRTTPLTVRPGDSLWRITERRLPPRASDAEVEAGWRALYARNRDRVGPDPDLIHPGTALRPVDPTGTEEETR